MTRPFRFGNVGLQQLARELVKDGRIRPVEDVQALPLASQEELDRVLPKPKPRHRARERRAHLRQDAAGVPCACDDQTPCLAHHDITGRRRFVRPS
jgi:hypothetical protein